MDAELYDGLKLKNQLCFPLYACAKEVSRRYKPFLDELDLTYTQYIAMMVIWEQKQINVRELGEQLYLDSGTLTPLLKKLEAKGYIIRERSKEDERSLNISISEKAKSSKKRRYSSLRESARVSLLSPKRLWHFIQHCMNCLTK